MNLGESSPFDHREDSVATTSADRPSTIRKSAERMYGRPFSHPLVSRDAVDESPAAASESRPRLRCQ